MVQNVDVVLKRFEQPDEVRTWPALFRSTR
jgi:hypothetical protein